MPRLDDRIIPVTEARPISDLVDALRAAQPVYELRQWWKVSGFVLSAPIGSIEAADYMAECGESSYAVYERQPDGTQHWVADTSRESGARIVAALEAQGRAR